MDQLAVFCMRYKNDQTEEAREPHEHDAAAWAKHIAKRSTSPISPAGLEHRAIEPEDEPETPGAAQASDQRARNAPLDIA
jgi:hypothetical protein